MARRTPEGQATAAREAVGTLTPRMDVTIETEGDFDFLDAIRAVAAQSHPERIDLLVWTANSKHVAALAELAPLRVLIDPGFFYCRPPEEVAAFKRAAPAYRTGDCHIKAALLIGEATTWVVSSSANLNPNIRSEIIEITDDATIAGVLRSMIDAVFDAPLGDNQDAAALSDYDRAIPWMQRAGLVTMSPAIAL